MEPTQIPPIAPMAALIAKARTTMRVVEMPARLAESGSLAVAVIKATNVIVETPNRAGPNPA